MDWNVTLRRKNRKMWQCCIIKQHCREDQHSCTCTCIHYVSTGYLHVHVCIWLSGCTQCMYMYMYTLCVYLLFMHMTVWIHTMYVHVYILCLHVYDCLDAHNVHVYIMCLLAIYAYDCLDAHNVCTCMSIYFI